jgi:hypothetical protein
MHLVSSVKCSFEALTKYTSFKRELRASSWSLTLIRRERSAKLFKNWLPLNDEIKIQKCCLIYKRIIRECPILFSLNKLNIGLVFERSTLTCFSGPSQPRNLQAVASSSTKLQVQWIKPTEKSDSLMYYLIEVCQFSHFFLTFRTHWYCGGTRGVAALNLVKS